MLILWWFTNQRTKENCKTKSPFSLSYYQIDKFPPIDLKCCLNQQSSIKIKRNRSARRNQKFQQNCLVNKKTLKYFIEGQDYSYDRSKWILTISKRWTTSIFSGGSSLRSVTLLSRSSYKRFSYKKFWKNSFLPDLFSDRKIISLNSLSKKN